MTLRPIVRALTIPVLGLALTGAAPALGEGNAAAPASKTVNINQASPTELERLPRVGAKLAERIVAHRGEHGSFKRVEDLMEVKGIGEKMFATLKPYVSVSGQTTLTQKVSSKGSRTRGAKTKREPAASTPEKS